MAQADPHDMRSAPCHRLNLTTCICDFIYCLSCARGCPSCRIDGGLDRREVVRVTEPPIQVRILPDGAE